MGILKTAVNLRESKPLPVGGIRAAADGGQQPAADTATDANGTAAVAAEEPKANGRMSKRRQQKRARAQQAEEAPELEASEPASATGSHAAHDLDDLSKLREILYGREMRERRDEIASLEVELSGTVERLETKVTDQLEQANEALGRRLGLVERSILSKLDEFAARLRTEADQRLATKEEFEKRIADQRTEVDGAISELREGLHDAEGELRNQLLAQGSLLSSSIHKHHEEALDKITTAVSELGKSKADRNALAEILADFAQRVSDEAKS